MMDWEEVGICEIVSMKVIDKYLKYEQSYYKEKDKKAHEGNKFK